MHKIDDRRTKNKAGENGEEPGDSCKKQYWLEIRVKIALFTYHTEEMGKTYLKITPRTAMLHF